MTKVGGSRKYRKNNRRILIIFLVLLVIVGWRGFQNVSNKQGRQELMVMAASSLTESFHALAAEFETVHPGLRVKLNFAGTQWLRTQLEQGAEADLFTSANFRHTEALYKEHLVEKPIVFTRNKLVLILPLDNPAGIEKVTDLAKPHRLVLAEAGVPVGDYSRQVLAKIENAVGNKFFDRVLANLVSEETSVKNVLAKVALGEADAGIVYNTDLNSDLAAKITVVELPAQYNVPADYYISPLLNSQNRDLASKFIDFILSSKGQQLLESYGFKKE